MKLNIIKFLIPILIIFSCKNQEQELKEYGHVEIDNDSQIVSINIGDFKEYGELIDRIREVKCKDSIPKIVIESRNLTRNIYPTEHCEPSIFDPAGKHYVTFRDGTAYLHQTLQKINLELPAEKLLMDFSYDSSGSTEKPESYFVIIESMRNQKTVGIERFINVLTTKYDSLKTDAVLNLTFWEEIRHPPPPIEVDTILTE